MKKNTRSSIPVYGLTGGLVDGVAIKNLDIDQKTHGEHKINAAHRDDHYMLVLLRKGGLKANIEFEGYEFEAPFLLMVFPDQVHQLFQLNELSGWTISFNGELLTGNLKERLDKSWRDRSPFICDLPSAGFGHVDALLSIIGQLINHPVSTSQNAVAALLNALLQIVLGNIALANPGISYKKNRPAIIKQQFIQLLYQHYKAWKKPSDYAAPMGITTAHLNDTVRKITGRSVTNTIQEHCMFEARRLLHYTNLDVKAIALELGYNTPSHFIKIFKSIIGATPSVYRKKL